MRTYRRASDDYDKLCGSWRSAARRGFAALREPSRLMAGLGRPVDRCLPVGRERLSRRGALHCRRSEFAFKGGVLWAKNSSRRQGCCREQVDRGASAVDHSVPGFRQRPGRAPKRTSFGSSMRSRSIDCARTPLASELAPAKFTEARSIRGGDLGVWSGPARRLQMMAEDGQRLAAVMQSWRDQRPALAPHQLVVRILKLRSDRNG